MDTYNKTSLEELIAQKSMNVYFTASIVGKKDFLKNYLKIIDILKSKNLDVKSDHIIDATPSQIRLETRQERLAFHKKLENWINSCDLMVAETSLPSISVGYEISLALHRRKPVLILYSEGSPPPLFAQHIDDNIVCEKYTLDALEDLIDEFIHYVHQTNDSRFTFFITSDIASYLDKIARKEKIPKSVYLRKLIQADMDKHSL